MGNLALARRPGESIAIGPDIVVTVTKIEHSKVRLAIEAPAHVRIMRTELLERERGSQCSV